MKKGNKKSVAVIGLYALSILAGIYTLVTLYSSYTYVAGLVAQGFVVTDELLDVVTYFISNSAPYLFYAVSLWSIGHVINKLNFISNEIKINKSEEIEEYEYEEEQTEEEEITEEVVEEEITEEVVEEEITEEVVEEEITEEIAAAHADEIK